MKINKVAHITTGEGGEFQSAKIINDFFASKGILSSLIPIKKKDIFFMRLFDEGLISFNFLKSLRKEVKNKEVIFFHCLFSYSYLVILLFIRIFCKKRLIVFFRNDDSFGSFFRKIYYGLRRFILLNFSLIFASKIIFLTRNQKESYLKSSMFDINFYKKSEVMYNFLDKRNILSKARKFKLPNNLLFIGRLTKEKGFSDLIRLASDIKSKFGVVGQGEYILKGNINYFGQLKNVKMNRVYDSYNILILPSYAETFGRVIIEAMARGLVVLASNLPAIREYFVDGRNGYLFPPGDIEKMKELILYLKNNPKEMERISKNNLKDIWKFTAEKQVPKYIKVYEEVLKENRKK